jgi:hypothetical protein
MTTNRRDLEELLVTDADRAVPAPDPAFVARLEQHLMQVDLDVVVPLRRRVTRWSGAAVAAASITLVGAAAAAGVVVTSSAQHPSRDATDVREHDPGGNAPRPSNAPVGVHEGQPTTGVASTAASTVPPTVPPPSTTASTVAVTIAAPVTTVPVPTTLAVEPATSAAPPTTARRTTTVPATPAPTEAPTTVATEPATTVPVAEPTTAPATTTTEVHVPATITLSCVATASSVTCSWGDLPAGTARVLILRGAPDLPGPGRAFSTGPGDHAYTDTTALVPGTRYSYLVHAMDANGASLGHSNLVPITF